MKMKSSPLFLTLLAAGAAVSAAAADKDAVIHRGVRVAPIQGEVFVSKTDAKPLEKEKVTYLGVQTAPVGRALAAQLGLPRDTGLVVTAVSESSPAAAVLKEHDVLTKLDDQLLVDQHQLGVLIRAKKEGDEVTLTVVRGGKETKMKAKLGQHEVPKLAMWEAATPAAGSFQSFALEAPAVARLRQLPGMDAGQMNEVIRVIGNNRGNWFGTPGVQVFRRGGGATILDLPKGNMVYSDDEGSIEVKADDGRRDLIVKDKDGKVLHEGQINSKEDREKLPKEIKERLGRVERAEFSFEIGSDFKIDGADVRPATPSGALRQLGSPIPPQHAPQTGTRRVF
jgi:serine protease Do